MASQIAGKAQLYNTYGITVQRLAANLPQTATQNIFQIAGGRVLITTILGEVTTAVQAQANGLTLSHQNTAATLSTTFNSTPLESNGALVGNLISTNGLGTATLNLGSAVNQNNEIITQPGFIRLAAAASNTGQIRWTVTFIPFDTGASIVAV